MTLVHEGFYLLATLHGRLPSQLFPTVSPIAARPPLLSLWGSSHPFCLKKDNLPFMCFESDAMLSDNMHLVDSVQLITHKLFMYL